MGCVNSSPPPHNCYKMQHSQYPKRGEVKAVSWGVKDLDYHPVDFTHDKVKAGPDWADPPDWTPKLEKEVSKRVSNALKVGGKVKLVNHRPQNPFGRTGIIGRGLLGKYGPNQAADNLVTRIDPDSKKLQMIVIQRGDNKTWAMPGGFVDKDETPLQAARREFFEEACNVEPGELKEKLEHLFKNGKKVYVGYVRSLI